MHYEALMCTPRCRRAHWWSSTPSTSTTGELPQHRLNHHPQGAILRGKSVAACSADNLSPSSRCAYILHAFEGPEKQWAEDNWCAASSLTTTRLNACVCRVAGVLYTITGSLDRVLHLTDLYDHFGIASGSLARAARIRWSGACGGQQRTLHSRLRASLRLGILQATAQS